MHNKCSTPSLIQVCLLSLYIFLGNLLQTGFLEFHTQFSVFVYVTNHGQIHQHNTDIDSFIHLFIFLWQKLTEQVRMIKKRSQKQAEIKTN